MTYFSKFTLAQLIEEANAAMIMADNQQPLIRLTGLWGLLSVSYGLRTFTTHMPKSLNRPAFFDAMIMIVDRLVAESAKPIFPFVAWTLADAIFKHRTNNKRTDDLWRRYAAKLGPHFPVRGPRLEFMLHHAKKLASGNKELMIPAALELAGVARSIQIRLETGEGVELRRQDFLSDVVATAAERLASVPDNAWLAHCAIDLVQVTLCTHDTPGLNQALPRHIIALAAQDPYAAHERCDELLPMHRSHTIAEARNFLTISTSSSIAHGNVAIFLLSRIKNTHAYYADAKQSLEDHALGAYVFGGAKKGTHIFLKAASLAERGGELKRGMRELLRYLRTKVQNADLNAALALFHKYRSPQQKRRITISHGVWKRREAAAAIPLRRLRKNLPPRGLG